MTKAGFGYDYSGGLGQRLQKAAAERRAEAERRVEAVRAAGGGLKARIDAAQGVTPRVPSQSVPRAPLAARISAVRDSFAA